MNRRSIFALLMGLAATPSYADRPTVSASEVPMTRQESNFLFDRIAAIAVERRHKMKGQMLSLNGAIEGLKPLLSQEQLRTEIEHLNDVHSASPDRVHYNTEKILDQLRAGEETWLSLTAEDLNRMVGSCGGFLQDDMVMVMLMQEGDAFAVRRAGIVNKRTFP